MSIPDGNVPPLIGVEGSYLLRGELVNSGWKAAAGTIVCRGDVICSDQRASSLVVLACTISSIPKIDLDSDAFMLILWEYGLYSWRILD